ncbi:efflux RND transporter periplasmic adaptor subunit [Chitinophaga rhizosphaerae]|uniref:efflux RND transporter periplasmic adaptor subunit n=1 Tax=Chitinophaga rhizosphaerae TaxID=1864947 RepID=UPI000F80A9C1|nr:HlyD family efflux transporter periplasmic adaptor subunit [Chitinophaga rhizosphaerae]
MKMLLLTVLMLPFCSCTGHREKIRPDREDITESVYASGIVKSGHQYEVFSTVNGIAARWLVKEGGMVGNRQPILEVLGEAARLQAENASIVAQNAARQANSRRIEELRIHVEDAKLRMDQSAVDLQRQRNLWAQQIGSRNELEQRELAWKSAQNAYASARLRYDELQREIGFGEKQALKNLEISRSAEADHSVKSERGGKLFFTFVEEGEMVNTQQPVAVIGDPGSFILELQVDEYDVAQIRQGQHVAVSMDSYKGQVFDAVVETLKPYMNERTKTFTVEALFLRPPPALYPNLTCEANIIVAQRKQVLTIPRSYLLDGNFVLLENGRRQQVSTGLMDYRKVEITGGITPDNVILKPEK